MLENRILGHRILFQNTTIFLGEIRQKLDWGLSVDEIFGLFNQKHVLSVD